jgi:hypothetical protein
MFEEYQDGTLILLKHSNMLSFSSLLRVQLAGLKLCHPFSPISGCRPSHSSICCNSYRASSVSFVFLYTPRNPIRLTQRFFVTCITSIELRTSKTF